MDRLILLIACLVVVYATVPRFNELNWRDLLRPVESLHVIGLTLMFGGALGVVYHLISVEFNYYSPSVISFFIGSGFNAAWIHLKDREKAKSA